MRLSTHAVHTGGAPTFSHLVFRRRNYCMSLTKHISSRAMCRTNKEKTMCAKAQLHRLPHFIVKYCVVHAIPMHYIYLLSTLMHDHSFSVLKLSRLSCKVNLWNSLVQQGLNDMYTTTDFLWLATYLHMLLVICHNVL